MILRSMVDNQLTEMQFTIIVHIGGKGTVSFNQVKVIPIGFLHIFNFQLIAVVLLSQSL